MALKKILIVEDEIPLMKALASKLKEEHFDILQAYNGSRGLETAMAEHPDLILLDLMLPQMDGMSVLRALRKDTWGKDVPIFILTNYDSIENITEGVKNRANEFLVKSNWTLADIVTKVKNEFKKSSTSQTPVEKKEQPKKSSKKKK